MKRRRWLGGIKHKAFTGRNPYGFVMTRTPSSLNWLIQQYARVQGDIKEAQKRIASEQSAIDALKAEAEALERVIGRHDVKVDVDTIRPIVSREKTFTLPHGTVTRLVLTRLRQGGASFTTTSEVLSYLVNETGLELPLNDFSKLKDAVRDVLKKNAQKGLIERGHDASKLIEEGLWRIKPR